MSTRNRRSLKRVRLPLTWRIMSILAMLPLAYGIFILIFRKSGGTFPLAAGDSTDPIFFASLFGVLLPALFYLFVVDTILKGVAAKRSGGDIAKDVALDVGKAAAEVAADVILSGGSNDGGGSSGDGMKGGGGGFGGGGGSGGY